VFLIYKIASTYIALFKLAHRVIRGAATYLVAIGRTADIDRNGRWSWKGRR